MKVILAIGHSQVEKAIENNLPSHCEVVGVAAYREAVLTKLEAVPTADVVFIRDNLQGSQPIMKLIHQIRTDYPHCRIILMTKMREAGDPFLAAVVSYAVWDIILGYKVEIKDMVDYILNPRTFKDVEQFQKRSLIDESTPILSESDPVITQNKTSIARPTRIPLTSTTTEAKIPLNPEIEASPTKPNGRNPIHLEQEFSLDPIPEANVKMQRRNPIPVPIPNVNPMEVELPTPWNDKALTSEPTIPSESVPSFGFEKSNEQEKTVRRNSKQIDDEEVVEPQKRSRSKPKLFSTEDMDTVKKPLVKERVAVPMDIKSSPITMSLIGFKGGVGTSQTAFNLAIQLAHHKNKVLYVELNDHSVPLTYLYNLSSFKGGLEDALFAVHEGKSHDTIQYVTRMKELKKETKEKEMVSLLKPYPDTLDFITFSHFFTQQKDHYDQYHPECLQEFLMSLLLSQGYQYIILDVNAFSSPILVAQALRASKYIFPVITQDMLSISQTVESLKLIHETQVPLSHKTYLIVNRYDNSCYAHQSILKWVNHELPFPVVGSWTVPEFSSIYNKANDRMKPVVLASPPKPLHQAFESMHNYLKTM